MSFAFANINNSFSNLVQADSLPNGMGAFENSGNRPSLFADNLNQVIKGARAARASVSTSTQAIAADQNASAMQENLDEAKIFFLEEVNQEQGLLFLSKLQNMFLSLSGGDLNNITLDTQGLDALKEMLLKAGFEPGEVEELMSGLSEKAQGGDLSLDEVMGGIFNLSTDIEDETMEEEACVETSALPFLTSILNSLGLPNDTVNQIMSQANRGQNGISLDVVIDQLKAIETQSFYAGQSFQTREGDTSFSMLLEQLGLVLPENMTSQPGLTENMTSQLGLSDFIVSLETHKEKILSSRNQAEGFQGMGPANQSEGAVKVSSNTMVDSLFKHLEIQAGKAGVSEFSHDQIKDQFENDLLVPDKFKPNKEGLSSQGQPELGVKQGKVLKEIDSILPGKSGLAGDAGPKFKDGEDIAKLVKSNTARGGETALATSDVKTGTIGDALKTKSTFRDLPTHVTNQVSKGIVRAINQGETTLKIQLKPAELGRLQLTINNVGNSMKVSITAENPAAKDILIANVNELKTVLASAGISLDKFDVDMNSEFKQSYANAKNESGNSRQKNRNGKNLFDSIGTEGMDGSNGSLTSEIQDGSYHFVA